MRLARPGFAARSVLRLPIRRALHRLGDPPSGKPVFYDMAHSNNAARIRLWRLLKEGMTEELDRCVVAYPDLKTPAFKVLNPLQKVPALVHADGTTVFESNVILDYLDDKYCAHAPSFKPPTAEGRQLMNLFIRIHDLYIASPNCCAPGFSHCQGAMYLSNGWHGAARGMDLPTREAKIGEIWRQLNWLEAEVTRVHADAGGPGPYMLGEQLTLADLTWFPTCVFMEYMLPRVFGWAPPFAVGEGTPFPALAAWYTHVREAHAELQRCAVAAVVVAEAARIPLELNARDARRRLGVREVHQQRAARGRADGPRRTGWRGGRGDRGVGSGVGRGAAEREKGFWHRGTRHTGPGVGSS